MNFITIFVNFKFSEVIFSRPQKSQSDPEWLKWVFLHWLSPQLVDICHLWLYLYACCTLIKDQLKYLQFKNTWLFQKSNYLGKHERNRRNKLILEIELSKGFAPTRLVISIFHRLIGQYFESGILFISLAILHGGERWLDVWERRRQAPLYWNQSPRWVCNAYYSRA